MKRTLLALQGFLVASVLFGFQSTSQNEYEAFFDKVFLAARTGNFENLKPFFVDPGYLRPLEQMVSGNIELRKIGCSFVPAPPGFENYGKNWIVFYKYQRAEDTHDVVYPIVVTGLGLRLGSQIPVDVEVPYSIEKYDFDVYLNEREKRAEFTTKMKIKRTGKPSSILMRINYKYIVQNASLNGKELPLYINQKPGSYTLSSDRSELVQSGSIVYVSNFGDGGMLELKYSAQIDEPGCDEIVENHALFTSYWWPFIGLQPAPSHTKINIPANWHAWGVGNQVKATVIDNRKIVEFENPVPICFHHIVAGPYLLAYEVKDQGRTFRAWHWGSVNEKRGKHDAEMARDAVAFFERRFGKFPYQGYDIIDTPEFYGLEAYSFTILSPRITEWATSHEIGHTYFGGLVPNTYLHSIWNETLTQYIDSIQFKNNSDRTLESGYALRKTSIALDSPFTPHGPFGLVGYMRGAYTMKMLENEIGLETMNACLRALVEKRFGKTTEWNDIEKIFNATANRSLTWFFDQWIRSSTFPTVTIERLYVETGPEGGFNTSVRFQQSGTAKPFRLRFVVVLSVGVEQKRFPVVMTQSAQQYNLETPWRPEKLSVDPMGWTLAEVPEPVSMETKKQWRESGATKN